MPIARVLVPLGTHLNLAAVLLGMKKGRLREVQSLAQVTQLIRGGAGIKPRLPSSRDHGASERKTGAITILQAGTRSPEDLSFLLMSSQPEMDMNPEPVSFPSQAWG